MISDVTSCAPHVKQWIGASGVVGLATADDLEPPAGIERNRLRILLVDVQLRDSVHAQHMIEQKRSDSTTANDVIHEQHFQSLARGPGKSDRPAIDLRDGQPNVRQIRHRHFRLDQVTVFGGKKAWVASTALRQTATSAG